MACRSGRKRGALGISSGGNWGHAESPGSQTHRGRSCSHANASLQDLPPWSAGRGVERADLCAALPGIDRSFSGYLVRSVNRDSDAGRSGVGAARAAVVAMLDAAAEEIRA